MPAYIRVTPLTVPVCALHHRNVFVMIQNFPNCPIHSKVSVWDNMSPMTRRVRPLGELGTATVCLLVFTLWQSPIPPDILADRKKIRECVVSHTLVLCVRNATRININKNKIMYEQNSKYIK